MSRSSESPRSKPHKRVFVKEAMEAVAEKVQVKTPNRGPNDLRFQQRLGRVEKELTQKSFNIDGLGEVSTNQVWEWICVLTAEGNNLKDICSVAGAPSIRTVFAWRRKYPVFDAEFKNAEEIRAYLVAEEATDTGRNATPETAQASKVAFQALTWRAAKLDPSKFADKKIEEHRHDFSDLATEELKGRVAAMIAAHPHLAGLAQGIIAMKEKPDKVLDVEPIKEEPPPS